MKLTCEIVEDLLPLYEDGVCSRQSKDAVEAHLRKCERCRKLLEKTRELPEMHREPEVPAADAAAVRSFKKLRKRWWISLTAVAVAVSLLFLGWNLYRDRGDHAERANALSVGNAFMEQLSKGEYAQAYQLLNLEEKKQEWLDNWFEAEELVNMEADGLAKFCEFGAQVEEAGGIQSYEYVEMNPMAHRSDGTRTYQLTYKILYREKESLLHVDVSTDGVDSFYNRESFLEDPLARLAGWSQFLWQDYEG